MANDSDENKTWAEFVAPHVSRFETAAIAGTNYSFNPEGCAAMAKMLKRMATLLDQEVAARRDQTMKGIDHE